MLINDTLVLATLPLANFLTSGAIGTAAATVDVVSSIVITQTTASVSLTIPSPTDTTAGQRLEVANHSASSQAFTIGGTPVAVGSIARFSWDGAAWLTTLLGVRNQGASISQVNVAAGASVVTHNLALPTGRFSSINFRAYNSTGSEVVFRRNKATDTANVMGLSSPIALTGTFVFDITPLA